jgi:hypothetical protein
MSDTRDRLQETAAMISTILPPHTGFVLLAFDFKTGGRMEYVSNGRREDVIKAMKEFIDHATAENFGRHAADREFEFDPRLPEMSLWAWVGEDEFGDQFGLKQGRVPAGMIPLVACEKGKMSQDYIKEQLAAQGRKFGKTISLVKFCFERIEIQVP